MTSERLGFGRWRTDDDMLADATWGDPAVSHFLGGPFTAGQVRARLDLEIANACAHGSQYWPLFLRASGEHVGCCGLRPRDAPARVFELGFHLRPHAWGQGLAAEAAGRVIGWARGEGLAALIAGHHPDNHASARTLRRLGFHYTHDEMYPPTAMMEPCYRLDLIDAEAGPH